MRRLLLTCLVGVAAGTTAHAATVAKSPRQRDAVARLVSCVRAPAMADRSMTVEGAMRSLRAHDRMQMRFDLFQRVPGGRFTRLAGPGLWSWNSASPGVARYRFRKRIENLPAPGTFRVKVEYRWRDGAGKVFARTTRRAPNCVEPDYRPDLRVGSVSVVRRLGPNLFDYRVVVRNAGRTASGDFDLVATIDGVARPARTVASLAPGERRGVDVSGPRCPTGHPASVTVDPDNRVGESNEDNNTRSITCP